MWELECFCSMVSVSVCFASFSQHLIYESTHHEVFLFCLSVVFIFCFPRAVFLFFCLSWLVLGESKRSLCVRFKFFDTNATMASPHGDNLVEVGCARCAQPPPRYCRCSERHAPYLPVSYAHPSSAGPFYFCMFHAKVPHVLPHATLAAAGFCCGWPRR